MNTDDRPRPLRTRDEIFAAGRTHGRTLPLLTEDQVDRMATILAPALNPPIPQSGEQNRSAA